MVQVQADQTPAQPVSSPAPQTASSPQPASGQIVQEGEKSKWWVWVIIALVVILAGFGSWFFYFR